MKILIIQQKFIGDVLTSSILCEAIREYYPNYKIHYLINDNTLPVVENNPFIDKVQLVKKKDTKNALSFIKFLLKIRKEKYDIVIDLYRKNSSYLICLFSGAKIKASKSKWYTKYIFNRFLQDYNVNIPSKSYAGISILDRLSYLKMIDIDLKDKIYKPKIYLKDSEIKDAKQKLIDFGVDFSKKVYMISVLGSSDNKTYPYEYMAQVLNRINEKSNVQILFNYIPNQKEKALNIFNNCSKETQKNILFDAYSKSLREFLAFTHHCNGLIGNEGGATNMAKALNIPTFTIFSPFVGKKAWGMFDDGINNVSVHLRDYINPKKNINEKDKESIKEHYLSFTPDLYFDKLDTFILK